MRNVEFAYNPIIFESIVGYTEIILSNQRNFIYKQSKFNLLEDKEIDKDIIHLISRKYETKCMFASFELKSHYANKKIESYTLYLRMKQRSGNYIPLVVRNYFSGEVVGYTHHIVEVFNENEVYKVLDILHNSEAVTLEEYIAMLCILNNCSTKDICYDRGAIVPCHMYASNCKNIDKFLEYINGIFGVSKTGVYISDLVNPGFYSDIFVLSKNMLSCDYLDSELYKLIYDTIVEYQLNCFNYIHSKQETCDETEVTQVKDNVFKTLLTADVIRYMIFKDCNNKGDN